MRQHTAATLWTVLFCAAAASFGQTPTSSVNSREAAQAGSQSLPADAAEARERLGDEQLLAPLRAIVPEVKFEDTPLDQAIDWLRTHLQVNNLHVRWSVLADAGIARDHRISLHVRELAGARVLKLILDEAGGEDLRMGFEPQDGVLVVSTAADVEHELITRVYPVRDLLLRGAAWWKQVVAAGAALDPNQPKSDAQPGGDPNWKKAAEEAHRKALERLDDAADRLPDLPSYISFAPFEIERLIRIVQQSIVPDSWEVNNGRGTVLAYHASLIVTNSREAHRQLDRLLATLRRADKLAPVVDDHAGSGKR